MPKLEFVKEKITLEVPRGANLRKEARKAGVQLYSWPTWYNCKGFGQCGRCFVLLKDGTISNANRGWWQKFRLFLGMRNIGHEAEGVLACRTRVMGDLMVETKPTVEQFLYGDFR